jgi:diketogulonate reductase-like aldo/keto reductase
MVCYSEQVIPTVTLQSKQKMPQVGYGLWQVKDKQQCIDAVVCAAEAGYRHFDTAQVYGNEQFLAEGLRQAKLKRADTFITTKIFINNFLRVEKSLDNSLKKLDTDYVDLLLLHFPVSGLRKNAWKKLEMVQSQGKARSIGVSNYTIRHLKQLFDYCQVKPAINQVELHVFLQQPELLAFCREHNIVVQAYSPLAHGRGIDDPVLAELAQKHGKTPAQIMLRWCLEVGTVPLPKSVTPERIAQNIDIFDFTLDSDDMRKISELEKGLRTCWDPTKTP